MLTGQFLILAAPADLDQDAIAWRAAVVAAGGTVTATRLVRVSTLIKSLKSAGVWASLDRLWLHAAESSIQALTDLKARAVATAVNSPTFTTDRGYAGNGTTSYLDLGLNANAATYFTRDDASFGGWISLSPTANGGFDFGWDYGGYSMLLARYGATSYRFEINAGTNPSGTPANGGLDTGFFHGQRTAAAVSALFRNGVSVISSTAPSTALGAKKFGAGAYVAGPANFSTSRYAASFIGASLAGKEAAFYTPMRTFMTAVGVP